MIISGSVHSAPARSPPELERSLYNFTSLLKGLSIQETPSEALFWSQLPGPENVRCPPRIAFFQNLFEVLFDWSSTGTCGSGQVQTQQGTPTLHLVLQPRPQHNAPWHTFGRMVFIRSFFPPGLGFFRTSWKLERYNEHRKGKQVFVHFCLPGLKLRVCEPRWQRRTLLL